ncbi:MAG: hypothetical protein M3443_14320 [Actinomycetota bacterium]|nr:hypothetical protein [Actinomycetota bacterium]
MYFDSGDVKKNQAMSAHVFVDETKSRGLLLTAAVVLSGDLRVARREMRGLVMHGQRRLHFTKEQDSRRKAILDTIESLRPQVLIYDGSRHRHHRQRGECLRALMVDLAANNVERLVLELDESVIALDERVLYEQKRLLGCTDLRFEHLRAHSEPLLAIPERSHGVGSVAGTGRHGSTR